MTIQSTITPLKTFQHRRGTGWNAALADARELDSPRTLVLVFGSPAYLDEPQHLGELRAALPRSVFCGCSTAGEIFGPEVCDESLSVAVMRFRRTELRTATAPCPDTRDSYRAGKLIADQLALPGLRGVLVLSRGLGVNGSELVRGINQALPESVIVTGGLAGDGTRFQRTWTLHNEHPVEGVVTAVGLYGESVRIGHGSRGGWDVFGPQRVVTRSAGNVLYELDGQPALPLYKKYLGDLAQGLPSSALRFPLALRSTPSDPKSLVRAVLSVDEAEQSLAFAGDIPTGFTAQLMRANFDRLIEGAGESARLARDGHGGSPVLAIAISCIARRLILGQQTDEELERCLELFPPGTQQVGFYSYGELSPFAHGACDLHNQTMTLTTISEE